MSYQLWINDEAKSEIQRLPGHVRQRIREAIRHLSDDPRPHKSIRMDVSHEISVEVRRIRIDSWRVIYIVDDEWLEIGVLAVRKRPPYDYDDLTTLLSSFN